MPFARSHLLMSRLDPDRPLWVRMVCSESSRQSSARPDLTVPGRAVQTFDTSARRSEVTSGSEKASGMTIRSIVSSTRSEQSSDGREVVSKGRHRGGPAYEKKKKKQK